MKPPKIDGILDDACWRTAADASPFARLTSPVTQQTDVMVCADSTHLYVAFRCAESQMNLVKSSETQRNGNTWVDDYVSVDIDSQNNRHNFSQFIITKRGTQNENLEGGTADNITWAGDWRASTHHDQNGWTAELSIPFALLRYPRGTHSFGIQFERKLARDTSSSYWPARPAESQSNPVEYFASLANISPTFYHPQPVLLPYTLLSAGEGNSGKVGMDIKYPINSSLTGLATINPDFGTVEQNVTNINFSYTQKYINDQRPFFIEGTGFFPYSDIFYSPSVANVDEGLKVTGKENGTAIALLATNQGGPNYQRATVASFNRDLSPLNNFEVDYAGNDQAGEAPGQVVKEQGDFGVHLGRDTLQTVLTNSESWLGGKEVGGQEYYNFQYSAHAGHPSLTYTYQGVAPNFNSELGYIPNFDYKGPSYQISQSNTFDKGYIQTYSVSASYMTQNHWSDNSFFQNNANVSLYMNTHTGNGFYGGITQSRRDQYRDHINEIYFEWNNKSLYDGGNIDYQRGSQSSEQYTWYSFNQGYGVTRKCSLSLNYNYQDLGGAVTTQTVFTPTYRLTAERSIGGRIVNEYGSTDIYFTYAQKARTGADVYIIFGDPNSPGTKGLIQTKVIYPF